MALLTASSSVPASDLPANPSSLLGWWWDLGPVEQFAHLQPLLSLWAGLKELLLFMRLLCFGYMCSYLDSLEGHGDCCAEFPRSLYCQVMYMRY